MYNQHLVALSGFLRDASGNQISCVIPFVLHVSVHAEDVSHLEYWKFVMAFASKLEENSSDEMCRRRHVVLILASEIPGDNPVDICKDFVSDKLMMSEELCDNPNTRLFFMNLDQAKTDIGHVSWPLLEKLHGIVGFPLLLHSKSIEFSQKQIRQFPSTTFIGIDTPDWPFLTYFGTQSIRALQNWNKPSIKLEVITYNRPQSLRRLLNSLVSANYLSDSVSLTIRVEAGADDETSNLVNSIRIDPSERIICKYNSTCNDVFWTHGSLNIYKRFSQAGLMLSLVESWYPWSRDEYVVLLEDDIELSDLFYVWLKWNLLSYRYGIEYPQPEKLDMKSDSFIQSKIIGISLYTPKIHEIFKPFKNFTPYEDIIQKGFSKSSPFLFQIPCSWGALYFPETWREYIRYLAWRDPLKKFDNNEEKRRHDQKVIIPDTRSNIWSRSWKRYMIEMMVLRGYSMLYPNFYKHASFSTNHIEAGVHVGKGARLKMLELYKVDLLRHNVNLSSITVETQQHTPNSLPRVSVKDSQNPTLRQVTDSQIKSLKNLPVYSLHGELRPSIDDLIEYGKKLNMDYIKCGSETQSFGWDLRRDTNGKVMCWKRFLK